MDPTPQPILVPISPGELVDRITILQLRADRLADPAAADHARDHLAALTAAQNRFLPPSPELDRLTAALAAVNAALWDLEDRVRALDRAGDGPAFAAAARAIFRLNDERSRLKQRVNDAAAGTRAEARAAEGKTYVGPG